MKWNVSALFLKNAGARILLSVFLVLLLLSSTVIPAAAADASLTYTGHGLFSFDSAAQITKSDLFGGFKDLIPGDQAVQTLSVKNTADCCDYIRVYLRAEPHGANNPLSAEVAGKESLESMADFLSQLSMEVIQGDKTVFQGAPGDLEGLKDNVCLGDFRRNTSTELKIILTVPLDLGNEYADRAGEVDWVFTVEEYNDDDPNTPQTGDHANFMPYVFMLAAGMAGLFFLLLFGRKKKDETA